MKIVSIGDTELICYRVIEEVDISIGDIILIINIFVLEIYSTDLLLEQLFMDISIMTLIQQREEYIEYTIYNVVYIYWCIFNMFKLSKKKITRENRL